MTLIFRIFKAGILPDLEILSRHNRIVLNVMLQKININRYSLATNNNS